MRVGIIGYGAIGSLLIELLNRHVPTVQVEVVYERDERLESVRKALDGRIKLVGQIDELAEFGVDLVIECAGHQALRNHGVRVLSAGSDLLVASVGALADAGLEADLRRAAASSGSSIRIPSGALGGLDALGAAKLAGIDSVRYEAHKAPGAWRGTPVEDRISLDDVKISTVVFEGNAREAATLFPQNANVTAAVALAGVGFDKTSVVLHADPYAMGNTHRIKADGDFGKIDISVTGKTLPSNPKTSMLAPYSLVRAVASLEDTIVVA